MSRLVGVFARLVLATLVAAPSLAYAQRVHDVERPAWISGQTTFLQNVFIADAKKLQFFDSDSSNYVALVAPGTLAGDVTWTLPLVDGGANECLVTDGAGTLSWAACGGGSPITGSGTSGRATYWNGASSITSDADYTWDATNNILDVTGSLYANTVRLEGVLSCDAANEILQTDANGDMACGSFTGVTGSGASTYVAYFDGASSVTGEADFIYTSASNNLTIGTTADTNVNLEVNADGSALTSHADDIVMFGDTTGTHNIGTVSSSGRVYWASRQGTTMSIDASAASQNFQIWSGSLPRLDIDSGGDISIPGNTVLGSAVGSTPAAVLDVNGSSYFSTAPRFESILSCDDGSTEMLVTDASGNLSCGTLSASGVGGSGTTNQLAYFSGSTTLASSANAAFNGTDAAIGGASITSNLDLMVGDSAITSDAADSLGVYTAGGGVLIGGTGTRRWLISRDTTGTNELIGLGSADWVVMTRGAEEMRISGGASTAGWTTINGTGTAAAPLHVYAGAPTAPTWISGTDNFIFAGSGSNNAMSIHSATTASGWLMFTDTTRGAGGITYNHSADTLSLQVGASQQWRIDSSGNVSHPGSIRIGSAVGSAPAATLDVDGNAYISGTTRLEGVLSCSGSNALTTNGSGDIACGAISGGGGSDTHGDGTAANVTVTYDSSGTDGTVVWDGTTVQHQASNDFLVLGDQCIGCSAATDPVSELQIHEASSGAEELRFTNTTTGSTTSDGFVVGINAGEDGLIENHEVSSIEFHTASSNRMELNGSGYLSLGERMCIGCSVGSSPSAAYRLDINGRLRMQGNIRMWAQTDVRFYDVDSSHYTGLQAGGVTTSSVVYSLPTADGSSGDFLSTNGAGTLAWAAGGTGTVTGTGTSGQVAYWDGTSSITSESAYLYDATNNSLTIGTATGSANVALMASTNLTTPATDTTDYAVFGTTSGSVNVGQDGTRVYIRNNNSSGDLSIEGDAGDVSVRVNAVDVISADFATQDVSIASDTIIGTSLGTNPAGTLDVRGDIVGGNSAGNVGIQTNLSGDQVAGSGNVHYSFVGNLGTGMRRASSNVLTFDTSGSERVRIDASGNVGIGTTPSRALHVSDVMRLEPRATAPTSASQGDIYVDSTGGDLCFYDGTAWLSAAGGGTCA